MRFAPGTVQRAARHQQQVEELCAATIRALAGERDLHFRARRLHRGRRALPLYAPHLHPSLEEDDYASFRGAADGLALRLAHSDDALHARHAPAEPIARLVFDLLEQFRAESQGAQRYPGVRRNLRHRFEAWSQAFHRSGLTDTAYGLLLYTVAQVGRARVLVEPVVEATEDELEATRGALAGRIGHALAGLRRHRTDQAAYAPHALAIAATVVEMLGEVDAGPPASARDPADAERAAFSLVMALPTAIDEAVAAAVSGRSRVLDADAGAYRVYTTAYDREHAAAALVRTEVLHELRARLDRLVTTQAINLPRLARQLRAVLARARVDGWDSGREEGLIDGRRLAQLVASPTERRLFRAERIEPAADAVVGVLIDCSGSMKEHVDTLAALFDVFMRALEQAGVAGELLGYTTGAWNGGRAQRDWQRAGRPAHPGRLNERCHLVFKAADTPWRRARREIAALLKTELFREGFDGEAVEWACARLQRRDETRKLLLVVSDGSPMDSATNLANDAHYLDHHLRDVVARQEQLGAVQVCGVGVGLDLSPYYSRSHVLDPAGSTGPAICAELIELIAGHRQR